MAPAPHDPAPRACNDCTLCCKLLRIAALDKPRLVWCPHCDIGKGCRIYADRPGECENFVCGWLGNPTLGDEWRPKAAKMVLAFEMHGERTVTHINVDPGNPGVWREAPFYAQIKRWAVHAVQTKGQVLVWHGRNVTVVLPGREKNLGHVEDDKVIVILEQRGPAGRVFDAVAVSPDHPLTARLA